MKKKYLGLFSTVDQVRREFEADGAEGFPTDEQVIVAAYEYESYEGYAYVLYRGTDGCLYEVNGSHCSCRGLEGQWAPEKTTTEALAMRKGFWTSAEVQRLTAVAIQGVIEQ